jgi:hypothetical protein
MLDPICQHAQRERLGFGNGFCSTLAVRHDTGQIEHFGYPAPIFFAFNFDIHFAIPPKPLA